MSKVTINLPAAIFLRNVDGKALSLDVDSISPNVLADIFTVGAKTVLTNTWNGGGKDASEAEKLAAVEKKIDAWKRGEFNVVSRGDQQMTLMREQYVDERRAATGCTAKAVDKAIRDTVTSVLGKDVSATFDNFLDAVAKAKGGDAVATREAIESALWERTQAAMAKRAKVAASLDIEGIDLGL